MHPLKTNKDARKLKWLYKGIKVRNIPRKRLPVLADRAVREKAIKGRAGIRWDSVAEKTWNDMEGDAEGVMFIEKKYESRSNDIRLRVRERLALTKT